MDDGAVWVVLLVLIFLIPVMATLLWNGFNSSRGETYTKMRMQGPFVPSEEPEPTSIAGRAEIAAIEWLVMSDAGAYVPCWQRAAALLRGRIAMQVWEQQMLMVRTPLAKPERRTVLSAEFTDALPGVPDGEYVVVQFKTQFAQKENAIETVTMVQEDDAVWRVAGYYIR